MSTRDEVRELLEATPDERRRTPAPGVERREVRLAWRPRALADVQALRAYIAREQPAAATRIAERILAAVGDTSESECAGRAD